jgi:hypothetical protein
MPIRKISRHLYHPTICQSAGKPAGQKDHISQILGGSLEELLNLIITPDEKEEALVKN